MRLAFFALCLVCTTTIASAALPMADEVIVDKSERRIQLLADGEVLREFPIALGLEPVGAKREEGDNKTPEGTYILDRWNPNSRFFLSIHISYPSRQDVVGARARGVDPGGQIMIHGQPNEPKFSSRFYATTDWTNGCIAVSNLAMIDIWLMTQPGTPILIKP